MKILVELFAVVVSASELSQRGPVKAGGQKQLSLTMPHMPPFKHEQFTVQQSALFINNSLICALVL